MITPTMGDAAGTCADFAADVRGLPRGMSKGYAAVRPGPPCRSSPVRARPQSASALHPCGTIRPMPRGVVLLFIVMFCGVPGIFFAFGVVGVIGEHIRFVSAEAVPARITKSPVGGSWPALPEPIIYRFTYNGRQYTREMETIFFMGVNDWKSSVRPFTPGAEVTAYIPPGKPEESYLVREVDFFWYVPVIFPCLFFAAGVGVAVAGVNTRSARPPMGAFDKPGWFELRPKRSQRHKTMAWVIVGLAYSPGLAAIVHYLVMSWPQIDEAIFAFGGLYLAGLAVIVIGIIVRLKGNGAVREARVLINAPELQIGTPITVRVEQGLRKAFPDVTLRVGVVCKQEIKTRSGNKTSYSTNTVAERWCDPVSLPGSAVGVPLSLTLPLTPPDSGPESSPPDFDDYPFTFWMIRVETVIKGAPDYAGEFVVMGRRAAVAVDA